MSILDVQKSGFEKLLNLKILRLKYKTSVANLYGGDFSSISWP